MVIGGLNLRSYMNNFSYIWKIDYKQDNNIIASYINENYSNSVLGIENHSVRGYMNLLFGRGIYEYSNAEQLTSTAQEKSVEYAVMIETEGDGAWNVYDLACATI